MLKSILNFAWLATICISCLYLYISFQKTNVIESDLLALLPNEEQSLILDRAMKKAIAELSQKSVHVFWHSNFSQAKLAAQEFIANLDGGEGIGIEHNLVAENIGSLFYSLYFPARYYLVSPKLRAEFESGEFLRSYSKRVIANLSLPTQGAGKLITEDPFLLFSQFLASIPRPENNLSIRDGFLTAEKNGKFGVVIPSILRNSVFSPTIQAQALKSLERAEEQAARAVQDIEIDKTGAIYFANRMSSKAQWDTTLVSVGSFLGLFLLLWLAFQRVLPFLVTTLSVSAGIATGAAATIYFSNTIHLFTLGFGASLLGVCADYSIHFFCSRAKNLGMESSKILRSLLPSLILASGTSILGYLGLFFSPLPGLNQIAIFSSFGLAGTLLTVCTIVQLVPPETIKPRRSISVLIESFAIPNWIIVNSSRLCLIAVIIGATYMAYRIEFDDDVKHLQGLPTDLVAADKEIRELIGGYDANRFFITIAQDYEELLIKLEQLDQELAPLQKANLLGGYQTLSRVIPSINQQTKSFEAIRNFAVRNQQKIIEQLTDLNFSSAALSEINQNLTKLIGTKAKSMLTFQSWLDSPVSKPYLSLLVDFDSNNVAAIVPLKNPIPDLSQFRDRQYQERGIFFVDRASDTSRLFTRYRHNLTALAAALYLLISAILIIRFRRPGLLSLIPLAATLVGGNLALLLFGHAVSIFTVLANIIALGLSVDYCIFLLQLREERKAALAAILLSCLSTALSFGLLALSSTTVLQSFGLALFGSVVAGYLAAIAVLARESLAAPPTNNKRTS